MQNVWEADFKNPKTHWGKKLTKRMSVWLLSRSQYTLLYMRLADHITLNFYNNMLTAAVFLNIKKSLDTTWLSDLLHILSELEFLTSPIKLIASFSLTENVVFTDDKFSTPRKIVAGVLHIPSLTQYCTVYT
jgi:hypothetical protein